MGGRSARQLRLLPVCLALLQICTLVCADFEVIRKRRQQPTNMPQITDLDVTCEKTGMTVDLRFSAPFNGVIFSKGHFSNPACRYLESGGNVTSITFDIPMVGCGTSLLDEEEEGSNLLDPDLDPDTKATSTTGFSNIIIVQMDAEVQEVWDAARKINCEWISLVTKRVEFAPFEVEMLDFEEVKFSGDEAVDCFMDLQVGRYPESVDITEAVSIGEPLSLLVYAEDEAGMYDIHVKECFAYSSNEYENNATVKLQLTDGQGCVMRNKLLDGFFVRREEGRGGDDPPRIVAYGYLSAFKFPDVLDVFTTCEVEICKGECFNKCPEGPPSNDLTFPARQEVPALEATTTLGPFREGVELFGQPISCDDPEVRKVDPRCRQPKSLEVETTDCDNDPFNPDCPPDCLNFEGKDPRCLPDCSLDPFNPKCPADCVKYSGEDPRCPIDCNKTPLHPKCPPNCRRYTGKDDRCPCSQRQTHPNCPPDCSSPQTREKDPRCPPDCKATPFSARCPADCSRFAGQDPRCPCSDNPLSRNCPPDCVRFEAEDPRCKPEDCTLMPTHPQCPPDCEEYTGTDPRCPCARAPRHPNCAPDCEADRGDPRCPPDCARDPLNPRCPADCTKNAGLDPRCPCSKFPLHPRCPPNCKLFTGQDKRCPCSMNPLHLNCPADCARFTGRDPRCPCTRNPLHPACPPNCNNPLPGVKDPRCKDFCDENPRHERCEGVELFGQPLAGTTTVKTTTTTTTTITTTTTKRPRQRTTRRPPTQAPRGGRENPEEHHHHHDHHGHHGDPRFHPFHSFHYDPGDGRRGRNGIKKGKRSIRSIVPSIRSKRSVEFESERTSAATKSARARLARHIKVVDDSVPANNNRMCLSQESFTAALLVLLVLVFSIVFVLVFYCVREHRRRPERQNKVLFTSFPRNSLYSTT